MRNIEKRRFPKTFSCFPSEANRPQRDMLGNLHVVRPDIGADDALLDGGG
jgi:hypothetical protein